MDDDARPLDVVSTISPDVTWPSPRTELVAPPQTAGGGAKQRAKSPHPPLSAAAPPVMCDVTPPSRPARPWIQHPAAVHNHTLLLLYGDYMRCGHDIAVVDTVAPWWMPHSSN